MFPAFAFRDLNMHAFLSGLKPRAEIAARHTVGLVDPITAGDNRTR